MKILRVEVTNFGSYEHLEFDFSDIGLALIQGPTGSGKSTAIEAVFWCLYGETLRGGNVDEVRSWSNNGATVGSCEIATVRGTISVVRTRGSASENDLFWTESNRPGDKIRGKNLSETQALLEKRLGISADLYRTGSTYNEFAPTAGFFTSKAKERRALFEKIAPLDLPIRLAERSSEARKVAKRDLGVSETNLARLQGRYESIVSGRRVADTSKRDWQQSQFQLLDSLLLRHQNFEKEKASKAEALQTRSNRWEEAKAQTVQKLADTLSKLRVSPNPKVERELIECTILTLKDSLQTLCPECGAPNQHALECVGEWEARLKAFVHDSERYADLSERLLEADAQENPYTAQIEAAKAAESFYILQYEAEKAKTNPFAAQLEKLTKESKEVEIDLQKAKESCQRLEKRVSDLTQVYDLSFQLRGALLNRSVKDIEANTNALLERYFDSELRVTFQMDDSDGLDVTIHKSGYEATYRQLSRGQRCLLKLTFSLSVMEAAANAAGVHFGLICLDEPTDGLDADLKVKAYSLFEDLAQRHESVLVIEHDRNLQQMFSRKFLVTMEGDVSRIEEE